MIHFVRRGEGLPHDGRTLVYWSRGPVIRGAGFYIRLRLWPPKVFLGR